MIADKRQELERILEMICDGCHLTYVIRDQEKMMDKCDACPIEDAIKALIEQSAGCEVDGQNIRLPVPLGGKIYTAGVTEGVGRSAKGIRPGGARDPIMRNVEREMLRAVEDLPYIVASEYSAEINQAGNREHTLTIIQHDSEDKECKAYTLRTLCYIEDRPAACEPFPPREGMEIIVATLSGREIDLLTAAKMINRRKGGSSNGYPNHYSQDIP